MFTNEYKFDTEERREFAIRHIASRIKEGYRVVQVMDDESKTLVTFAAEDEINPECGLPYGSPQCGDWIACASICGIQK